MQLPSKTPLPSTRSLQANRRRKDPRPTLHASPAKATRSRRTRSSTSRATARSRTIRRLPTPVSAEPPRQTPKALGVGPSTRSVASWASERQEAPRAASVPPQRRRNSLLHYLPQPIVPRRRGARSPSQVACCLACPALRQRSEPQTTRLSRTSRLLKRCQRGGHRSQRPLRSRSQPSLSRVTLTQEIRLTRRLVLRHWVQVLPRNPAMVTARPIGHQLKTDPRL
jgi:hypothetical protein